MAASDKMYAVKLTENDVPGAKFRSCDISEHSVVELQRWLQCRGLKLSGNKPELIDRCKACLEAGGKNDIVVSIDEGKWFQKKVQEVLANVQSTDTSTVPVLPVTGWKDFPSASLPEGYCYGTIYYHVITTAKVDYGKNESEDLTDFNTSKPLMKGRQYFRSGHVKDIKHISKDGIQFIKCIVQASYSVKQHYNVSITLHGNSGKVLDASCDCKASAMSRCNHIAALLFAVDDYILEYVHHIASTSKLCSWNKGRKNKRDPQPCHTATYSKKMKPDRIIHFDPRPEQQDHNSFINNFITTLPSCHSSTMFQQILEINYEDYDVDKSQLTLRSKSALKLFKSTINGSEPYQICNTQTQSESEEWHRSRLLRITASTAKEVVHVKTDRGKYHLLRRLLWVILFRT
ncbi:uncharacterized protein LOC132744083 [Ruditapes philippinarum]|uniref:uncharacterized protein LOC132744083 n=1 Tax=Ruditapes philippinarum TaxID=129788 RepID=UPI00295B29D3|nr:uncharacterized protein LOC132744083 [Ruditapes philippinarum]